MTHLLRYLAYVLFLLFWYLCIKFDITAMLINVLRSITIKISMDNQLTRARHSHCITSGVARMKVAHSKAKRPAPLKMHSTDMTQPQSAS